MTDRGRTRTPRIRAHPSVTIVGAAGHDHRNAHDKFQFNANALFERTYRAEEPSRTEFLYQWQAKYRWLPQFEFGLQGFGEMGKWNDWAPKHERSHKTGPAIFGKLPIGTHQTIKYNAAWLLGTSRAAPDHTLRMQIEYEF